MTIRLNGQTSGYVELEAPAAAGSNTLVLPTGNGTSGQYLQTNGSGTLSWQTLTDTTGWTMDTSGTSLSSQSTVAFTSIPNTATKIILVFKDLSVSSNHNWRIRLGHDSSYGGFSYHVSSGYFGSSNNNNCGQMTGSFQTLGAESSSFDNHGVMELDKGSGNYWVGRCSFINETQGTCFFMTGYGDGGSNVLDRVALATTANTFDGGTAWCHYLEA